LASAENQKEKLTTARQILVVQTAFLGDALLGIPLLKSLRLLYPAGILTLLCRKGVGSFFSDASLVDQIIEVDKSKSGSWLQAREAIADRVFDVVICPHESFRTALFVSRINAVRKIGYKRFFNRFIFDDRVCRRLDLPEALRQLALLIPIDSNYSDLILNFENAQAGAGGQGPEGALTQLPLGTDMKVPALMQIRNMRHVGRAAEATSSLSAQVTPVIEPFLGAPESIIVLAPGSVWRTKMWTKEGFIETGRALGASRNALVVLMGAKDESTLCQEISAAIPNSISMAGRTSLYESAQLLAVADLLICNDSGAMHLGACAGIPIVSVFGPTVLELGYRPWSSKAVVVQTDLVCRPCGRHGAQVCPLGTHDCMKKVTSGEVIRAADHLKANIVTN
jgi:heptosyltransferase-2